jgi:hypothetical protein
LGNCIFYIFPMYEFSHSLGHKRRIGPVCNISASPPKPDIRANIVGRRFGPRPCENSNVRRARRNILEKLRAARTDNAADIRLDAMLENCILYISPTYDFHTAWANSGCEQSQQSNPPIR